MNKIVTVGVVLAVVGCETMSTGCVSTPPAYRVENRKIVLDSPFALSR